MSRLCKDYSAPHMLKIKVTHAGMAVDWYLNGSGVEQHNWMPGHNPWPLWFVRRVSDAQESNCHFEDAHVRMVTTFAPASPLEPFADNVDITIPTLVNTSALVKGEELKVMWMQRQKHKPERAGQITWASQARMKIGKQQKK